MENKLIFLGIAQVVISLIASIIILFISYKIINFIFIKKLELKKDTLSSSILTSGIFICVGLILSEIIPYISDVIQLSFREEEAVSIFKIISYSALYLFIGFLITLTINIFTFVLFSALTKNINELQEIKKNNIAATLLIVATLISITIIVKDAVALLISALIPFNESFLIQ